MRKPKLKIWVKIVFRRSDDNDDREKGRLRLAVRDRRQKLMHPDIWFVSRAFLSAEIASFVCPVAAKAGSEPVRVALSRMRAVDALLCRRTVEW